MDVYNIYNKNSENVNFDKNDNLFNFTFEDKTKNIKMEHKICINDIITESNKCNNNGNLVENDIVNNLKIGLYYIDDLKIGQKFIFNFSQFSRKAIFSNNNNCVYKSILEHLEINNNYSTH
jgi:hypothetical protein